MITTVGLRVSKIHSGQRSDRSRSCHDEIDFKSLKMQFKLYTTALECIGPTKWPASASGFIL